LRIRSEPVNDTLVMTAVGEVRLDTVNDLCAAVRAGVAQAVDRPLVVDLSAVTFFGAYGLAALLDATRYDDRPAQLLRVVVDASHPAIWPVELIGLDEVLVLYSTLEEATRADDPAGGAHRT
jgi:anti-anti-sigma factor